MKKLLNKIFIDFPYSLDISPAIFWLAFVGMSCAVTSIVLNFLFLGGII